jgi:hypothetical protein
MNMYEVGAEDRVEPAEDLPPPEPGAPLPVVLADDNGAVVLLFYASRQGREASPSQEIAVVRFVRCMVHLLGPPNDEAFAGHPLAARGLAPHGVFRVRDSSWVKALERMHRVHPSHRAEAYRDLTHYVITFHDSVFECLAKGASATVRVQTRSAAVEEVARDIGGHAA